MFRRTLRTLFSPQIIKPTEQLHSMNLRRLMSGSQTLGTAFLVAAAAWSASAADYSSTVLSQGPVGYWPLNETIQPPVLPLFATNIGTVGSAGNGEFIETVRGVKPGAIAG